MKQRPSIGIYGALYGHFVDAYNCLGRTSVGTHLLFRLMLLSAADIRHRNLSTRFFNLAKNESRGEDTSLRNAKSAKNPTPAMGIFGNSLTIAALLSSLWICVLFLITVSASAFSRKSAHKCSGRRKHFVCFHKPIKLRMLF